MRRLLLLFASLLIFICSYSQEIWKNAWCVTHTGDTIKGKVLFIDWDESPTEVTFIDTLLNIQRTFLPEEIRRLTIFNNGVEKFAGLKFNYINYPAAPIALRQDINFESDSLSRFLEILFESESIILYQFLGAGQEIKFYLQKDETLVALEHAKIQLYDKDKVYTQTINGYRGQLKSLLSECPSLKVSNFSYNAKSIIKLLETFHNYCKLDYRIIFENKDRGKYNLGIMAELINPVQSYNLAFRYLLPKKFNNRFLVIQVGGSYASHDQDKFSLTDYRIYTGTYFGQRNILPFGYIGFSRLFGVGDLGLGVSYKKMINFSVHASPKFIADGIVGYSFHFFPMFKGR